LFPRPTSHVGVRLSHRPGKPVEPAHDALGMSLRASTISLTTVPLVPAFTVDGWVVASHGPDGLLGQFAVVLGREVPGGLGFLCR
jgi:hypothetical protein